MLLSPSVFYSLTDDHRYMHDYEDYYYHDEF